MLFLAATTLAAGRVAAVDYLHDVQPILQQHCYACHGEEKQKGGLRLDIKAAAFRGGELYGSSILARQPDDSPLLQFVAREDADLKMPPTGSRLTAAEVGTLRQWIADGAVWPDGVDRHQLVDRRDHWSFHPRTAPPLPEVSVSDWPADALDCFIHSRLEQHGLKPSPAADRRTWLRRASLDLHGLPPAPEQIDDFLADERPDARDRIVDRLLASPRYGERYGQHWLDVVRYADTHGFEVNTERPHAWPYRDYVIAAMNRDTPYDQFIREQLVGDALGQDAATGFLVTAAVLLPGQIGKDDASKRLARQDELAEIVINTGEAFLGLSIGCARCHDHKFDPITQRDYYALQAFFSGVQYGDRPLLTPTSPDRAADAPPPMVYGGQFTSPEETRVLLRGDPEQPKDPVAPAVPHALGDVSLPLDSGEQQRRRVLADWIASADHPLTARVFVNRLWQWHFGIGLVETSSDFGRSGTAPSHPELLDHLATALVREPWSVKELQRRIVLSSTYGQASTVDPAAQAVDADVRLLWRFPARRLEAEAIRDSMLQVSDRLNLQAGGPGFDLFRSRGGLNGFPPIESFGPEGRRRLIYAHKVRMERSVVFGAFDCPDAGQSAPRRRQSATPIQALNLFNSQFTLDEAAALAARVEADVPGDLAGQVDRAFRVTLGRLPAAEEATWCQAAAAEHGLTTLCRALYNSNEFLFLP